MSYGVRELSGDGRGGPVGFGGRAKLPGFGLTDE